MDYPIVLTTTPTKFPARARYKAWLGVALVMLVVIAQYLLAMSRTGLSAQDLARRLATIPSRILAGGDVEGFIVLLVMPITAWFSIQSQRLKLSITAKYV